MTPPPEATVEAVELLACPWCNLEYQGHFQWPGGAWARYTVPDKHAPSCPLRGGSYSTEAELVSAWNTRPIPIVSREGQREAIARISFAPQAGDVKRWNAAILFSEKFPECGTAQRVAEAFARADAILALPAPPRHGEEVA